MCKIELMNTVFINCAAFKYYNGGFNESSLIIHGLSMTKKFVKHYKNFDRDTSY